MKRHFIAILVMALLFNANAQETGLNYIYLFDCTGSMKKSSLWEPAKETLKMWVENTPSTVTSVIVPFQDNVKSTISVNSENLEWQNLSQKLDAILNSPHSKTGICNAWEKGVSLIDTTKYNCVILLTDGKEEVHSVGKLCESIESFCGKHSGYAHVFYVQLGGQRVDAQILNAINSCEDVTLINARAGIPLIPKLFTPKININTHNLPEEFYVKVLEPREFAATIENLNTACVHLNFEIVDSKFSNGKARVKVSNRYSDWQTLNANLHDEQVEGIVTISVPNAAANLKEQELIVCIKNTPESVLTFDELTEGCNIGLGETTFYKPFMCFSGSGGVKYSYTLNYSFNESARRRLSEAKFKVSCFDENGTAERVDVLCNGKKCEGGIFTISNNDAECAQLEFIFNENDLAEGGKTLKISLFQSSGLDRINTTQVIGDTKLSFNLNIGIKEEWNVWKTILMWVGIVIVAGALLWFIFLRRYFYPTINKIGSIMITNPYYRSIKVKGAHKVILSNKPKSQSILSRIFTGKIIYENNPCWTTPVCLVSASKGIRVKPNSNYTITAATLTQWSEHNWINKENNNKITIKIN